MAKLTLLDHSGGYASTSALNANHDLIEAAFENTLSRDGTAPNSMEADFDMNSNEIINLGAPTSSTSAARLLDVQAADGSLPDQTGNANKALITDGVGADWSFPSATYVTNTPAGNISATTVQAAIDELDTEKEAAGVAVAMAIALGG